MKPSLWMVCVVLVSLVGCAGKGGRIDVAIPGKFGGGGCGPCTGPRIAVLPFEDTRANQEHLGQRSHLGGGYTYFDLPSGTVSQASAQALVDYLNRHGWRASLAHTQGSEGADVTMLGTLSDLSIDAKSAFMHTNLSAKNKFAVQIINHNDGSTVRERVSGSGTDQVFWFDPEDAQALMTDVLESNFKKFKNDVRIDGQSIRLK
jgi:hypothetical protein